MKKLIKMEFKRVFHSKMFYLSLGIGLLITTLQWIEVGLPMAVNIVDGYIPSEVSTPYSAFESFFRTGRSTVGLSADLLYDCPDSGGYGTCGNTLWG